MLTNIKERRKKVGGYPITELASELGFTLRKVGSHYYTLDEHDSVRIRIANNSFKQFSTGASGDCVSFLMTFGKEFDARFKSLDYCILQLEKRLKLDPDKAFSVQEDKITKRKKDLVLPEKDTNNDQIKDYLINVRRISSKLVQDWIDKGQLYQEKDWKKNCIFVSYDANGNPNFAMKRSSNKDYRFVQDLPGSDYATGFFINNHNDTIVVTEAVIEILSLQTLHQDGLFFNKSSFYALNGTQKYEGLLNVLEKNKEIKCCILALNNDVAGLKGVDDIRKAIHDKFHDRVKCMDYIPQDDGCDWNDMLKKSFSVKVNTKPRQNKRSSMTL